jgi:hypothetical protein
MRHWLFTGMVFIGLATASVKNIYAIDSTGSGDSTTTPQTVVARQPYLLDSGYWDTQTFMSPADFGTHGPGPGAPSNQCPTGFDPVVVLNTYKASPTGTPTYACSNAVTKNGTINYAVNISFSTSYDTTALQSYGNVGIYYSLYCYPQGILNQSTMNVSSCTNTPKAPFLLDTGTIGANLNAPGDSGRAIWFEVRKQCPVGYTPYAYFFPKSLQASSSNKYLNAFYLYPYGVSGNGACNFQLCPTCVQETALEFSAYYLQGSSGTLDPIVTGMMDVNYQLYCYPNGMTPGFSRPSFSSGPTTTGWKDMGNVIYANPPCTSN